MGATTNISPEGHFFQLMTSWICQSVNVSVACQSELSGGSISGPGMGHVEFHNIPPPSCPRESHSWGPACQQETQFSFVTAEEEKERSCLPFLKQKTFHRQKGSWLDFRGIIQTNVISYYDYYKLYLFMYEFLNTRNTYCLFVYNV